MKFLVSFQSIMDNYKLRICRIRVNTEEETEFLTNLEEQENNLLLRETDYIANFHPVLLLKDRSFWDVRFRLISKFYFLKSLSRVNREGRNLIENFYNTETSNRIPFILSAVFMIIFSVLLWSNLQILITLMSVSLDKSEIITRFIFYMMMNIELSTYFVLLSRNWQTQAKYFRDTYFVNSASILSFLWIFKTFVFLNLIVALNSVLNSGSEMIKDKTLKLYISYMLMASVVFLTDMMIYVKYFSIFSAVLDIRTLLINFLWNVTDRELLLTTRFSNFSEIRNHNCLFYLMIFLILVLVVFLLVTLSYFGIKLMNFYMML